MNLSSYNKDLFNFLSSSPTPFHAVSHIEKILRKSGFKKLEENKVWKLKNGQGYFVSREQGSIVAFFLGTEEKSEDGFRILGAHTDSPCLQIKPKPDITTNKLHQLAVEVYGGTLLHPWFDRNLSLAGRVCCVDSKGKIQTLLFNAGKPILTIPSVAIHLNRDANEKSSPNKQTHLVPVIGQVEENRSGDLNSILIEILRKQNPGNDISEILSSDIFCYDYQAPSFLGINEEFISAARLDNLVSCHAGTVSMSRAVNHKKTKNCLLFCSNHEENGSTSSVGAESSFLDSIFERIMPVNEQRRICFNNSFFISMDSAHATHPNYQEKSEANHPIELNGGPVIKTNANQRYATSSLSSAIYKKICKDASISPQEFVMRSDMACGSTIGPITAARLGVRTIDVGVPSLGMHSIRELTGNTDPWKLYKSADQFLKSNVHKC